MGNDSSARKFAEPTESLFSEEEAATSCLRATPFVPPPDAELRDFGREPTGARPSSTYALQTPSCPAVGTAASTSFPLDPAQAVDAVNHLLAKRRVRARASILTPAQPIAAITIEAPRQRHRNARSVVTRGLLMLALGGLLGSVGYSFRVQLASAMHALQVSITSVFTARFRH